MATPRLITAALILYIAISLGYQIAASISLVIGYFDLYHQVQEPFDVDYEHRAVTRVSALAKKAGLAVGDTLEALNGAAYTGRAQLQAARYYAHPEESMRVRVRKKGGAEANLAIPLESSPEGVSWGESIFVIVTHMAIPLVCLALGYWVVLARPSDRNAWLILILLSYPEVYISISTYNWLPGWLALRLFWHLTLGIMASVALLWLGLLFLERSRIDVRFPWLKWVVLALQTVGLGIEVAADYREWYDLSFFSQRQAIESVADSAVNWITVSCIAVYWFTLFEKLVTATDPDGRRRLKVLTAGSVVGLASSLIIWGLLPRFGVDPGSIEWIGYVSIVLLLAFPFSLAYVVIVQRAMNVRILIRMGTRYALARTTLLIVQMAIAALIVVRLIIPAVERRQNRPLNLVIAALAVGAIAWLFAVRRGFSSGMQQWLDRRFFREAYDAELVLSDLAYRARSITDPAALIETVSSRVSEVLHVPRVAVLLRDLHTFRLGRAVGTDLSAPMELPESSAPVRHLIETVSPAVLYREKPDRWFLESDRAQQDVLSHIGAELLLPLLGRSRLMGIMALGPKQSEEPYSPSDLRLLTSVGTQTGLGLEISDLARCLAAEAEQHQRIQRDIEIAHEVQERLFPQQFPAAPGTELAGQCRPALGIGGDYYDVFELPDGRLGFAIGDVSGKGIPAALLMASLRASLRGLADDYAHDLARLMRKLNRLVYDSSAVNRYATFFFAIYEPGTHELHYVNAGHNPIFVVRGEDEALRLEEGGPVIGLLRDVSYEAHAVQLSAGDVLLAYTDGISEAMTAGDEEWGEERMLAAARSAKSLPAERMLRSLFEAADGFTAGAPQHDDMTILLMKLT